MDAANALPEKSSKPAPSAVIVWLKRLLLSLLTIILLVGLGALYLWQTDMLLPSHSAPTQAASPIIASGDPIVDAIRRGAEYLRLRQEAEGHFSKGMLDPKPAFTAMVVDALARSPERYNEKEHAFIRKAANAIVARQQPNGAICTPILGLETYVTSVSIMALSALQNPEHAGVIQRAKEYLYTVQNTDSGSLSEGGAGYSQNGRPSGDLTATWVEAMKAAGVKDDDPAMKNAAKFLSRLQNSESNPQTAPGTATGSDGGFYYRPGESPAGYENGSADKKIPRSYGLMTYAALKAFCYLNVGRDDPRVESALRWVRDNYTLDENKNLGAAGLYYYYLTMAKALAAHGQLEIDAPAGKLNWAADLSRRLLALQRSDGSWCNTESDKWMENDAVLVTAFAIRTLSICHEALQQGQQGQKGRAVAPESGAPEERMRH